MSLTQKDTKKKFWDPLWAESVWGVTASFIVGYVPRYQSWFFPNVFFFFSVISLSNFHEQKEYYYPVYYISALSSAKPGLHGPVF